MAGSVLRDLQAPRFLDLTEGGALGGNPETEREVDTCDDLQLELGRDDKLLTLQFFNVAHTRFEGHPSRRAQ